MLINGFSTERLKIWQRIERNEQQVWARSCYLRLNLWNIHFSTEGMISDTRRERTIFGGPLTLLRGKILISVYQSGQLPKNTCSCCFFLFILTFGTTYQVWIFLLSFSKKWKFPTPWVHFQTPKPACHISAADIKTAQGCNKHD